MLGYDEKDGHTRKALGSHAFYHVIFASWFASLVK
jgi:hypothetical protein